MTSLSERQLAAARDLAADVAEALRADATLELWTGERIPLGPGAREDIRIVLHGPGVLRRLFRAPSLVTLAELLASGAVTIEGGSPLALADRWDHGRAVHLRRRLPPARLAWAALPFLLDRNAPMAPLPAFEGRIGTRPGAGRDDQALISFHYDVSNAFFALFLDTEMVYSSAYYQSPDESLETAQARKLDLICRKLRLSPGERLLDIGCGWGALAAHAARHFGVRVHGVTLSREQLAYGQDKIARLGLQDRVSLELRDYRTLDEPESYDKIAQVEMFEHVGFENFDTHFEHMHRLLRPRGLYFHQATVRRGGRDIRAFRKPTGAMKTITRFIFPGGELDYIGNTITNLGRLGFEVLDTECLREHMTLTLREWERRLWANRAAARAEAGEARTLLWLLYFAIFAKGFERGACSSYQTLAIKRAPGATGLPLDRASLYRPDPA